MEQILSPGVEYSEEPDFSTQVLGVASNGLQGFGGGPEENAVDGFLILESDGGNVFRHRKNDVEILSGENLRFPPFDPLSPGQGLTLGTVTVRAGVITRPLVAALIALFEMATEGSSPA